MDVDNRTFRYPLSGTRFLTYNDRTMLSEGWATRTSPGKVVHFLQTDCLHDWADLVERRADEVRHSYVGLRGWNATNQKKEDAGNYDAILRGQFHYAPNVRPEQRHSLMRMILSSKLKILCARMSGSRILGASRG